MTNKRTVNRTIRQTIATVLVANAETRKFVEEEFSVTGNFDEKQLLKRIETKPHCYALEVVNQKSADILYSMKETDFIDLALQDKELLKGCRVVSRTIFSAIVNCLVVNAETMQAENKKFIIEGIAEKTDAKQIEKLVKEKYNTPSNIIAAVNGFEVTSQLYYMNEDTFITLAKPVIDEQ